MSDQPLQLFQLVRYTDGAIAAVQSPPVSGGTLEVRYLHSVLRQELAQEERLWPLDDELLSGVCDRYAPYFQAIAEYMRPRLLLQRMSHREQFYWFIATEPEQVNGKALLGLSYVENLIGVQRKVIEPDLISDEKSSLGSEFEAQEDFVEGTGDPLLDLISDMHLVFKTSARHLLASYSPGACQRMLIYASRRKAQAMSKMKRDMDKDGGGAIATAAAEEDEPQQPTPQLTPQMKEILKRRGVEAPA